ncbi:MAG TPA: integrase arm-type DNA-binding domain-containing protein, partial [Casimicrobiaceae bacterium]|nr:integrase arm-type DNA-binding domain-containing protein [Casimicrobiaceae bacterium]
MLTHLEVLAIKPACKESYKHKDARGFHFYRHPTAESIYARLKYKINGKEKVFTLGTYGEDFTLQESFKMAKDLRYKIDNDGFDPLADKQAAKIASKTAAENTFAVVAERWLRKNKSEWTSESYYRQQRYRVERHLNPILGAMPFADIKPRNIAIALEKLEDRKKLSQAKKCSQI